MNVLIISIIISIIIGVFGLFLFKKIGILDTPWKYKDLKRTTPVPRLMGIFLIISVIVSIILLIPNYFNYIYIQALFAGAVFLGIIAIIDDIKGISAKFRFLIQIILSILGIIGGALITHINILGNLIELPYTVAFLISLLWFILIINSFNWFDGINGMGTGVGTIGFISIVLLIKFVILNNYDVTEQEYKTLIIILNLSFIMAGASFVFSFIEFKPWGLLRDVGIMFVGYVLAYLSLFAGGKLGILIVILSLVIFDAFWVIINRIKNKQNPMQGDYTHFHHRLMRHGWTREEIRMFVWLWSIFFMIIMILQGVNSINKIIIFILVFLIFFGTHIYLYWIKKLPQGMGKREKGI